MSSRHLVLGTAGHIDHGKSALVKALTGTDPDRLVEEKRRGITIDLGFADMELAAGQVLSFVDVPGHERFVRHMVAGSAGIDAVLLVVAADQGVQPQTTEHLEICSLLGLRHGLIALSKCDLVDEDLREVAALEVRELLEGSFLQDAPLIAVSARSGEGLESLRGALSDLLLGLPPRSSEGVARLPVDRSFVLRGFGTVVTGTLVSGTLREGDEVEIMPGGKRGRIRGLQVHHQAVKEVPAGRRAAVNLQGLDCEEVPRGTTVSRPGALPLTSRLWARLQLLPEAPVALVKGGRVRFHQGTCERAARLRPLGRLDDETQSVEIVLDQEALLVPGDRFILRRPAPVDTVGGGIVMDVRPPRSRVAESNLFESAALESAAAVLLRLARAERAGREPAGLAVELGITPEQMTEIVSRLERSGKLVAAGPVLMDAMVWGSLRSGVQEAVERFHAGEPLRAGVSREDLRIRISRALPQEAWRRLLDEMAGDGLLTLRDELVALAGHEVVLSEGEQELAEMIEGRFREGGLDPPAAAEVIPPAEKGKAERIIALLIARGSLVRIRDGKLFHSEAIARLVAKLREYALGSETIDVAGFKQLAGVTRKNAIPLLEHLDESRITRRKGNLRVILPSRAEGRP
jgi:selenocysteine-specific elongation factor